jgi:hypothetical protein
MTAPAAPPVMRLLPYCQTCGAPASPRTVRCDCGAEPHVAFALCGRQGCPCSVPDARPCEEHKAVEDIWSCAQCGWPAREHAA